MASPIKPKKYVNLQDTLKQKIVRIHNDDDAVVVVDNSGNLYLYTGPTSSDQYWIVYPVGEGIYIFVHTYTGKVLTNSTDQGVSASDYKGDATQQFKLETNIDNLNFYFIRNVNTGLLVQGNSIGLNGMGVAPYKDNNTTTLLWSFEVVDNINISNQLPSVQTLDPFPVYTDLENPLPDQTQDRLISYTLLPAPAVQDGQLTLKQKIQVSPYYLMEKYQYWTQLQQLSLAPGQTTTKQYEYGMDTTQVNEMTKTTGMTIHEDAGLNFSLGGIFGGSGSIRKEITDNLVIHESISSKVSEKVSKTSTFDNSSNQYAMYYAKYILTTKLVLTRFGSSEDLNSMVGTWTFSDPNTIRTTSLIPEAPKNDCTDCYQGVNCLDCPDCPQCQGE